MWPREGLKLTVFCLMVAKMSGQIVRKNFVVFLLLLSLCGALAGCGGQSAGISPENLPAQPVEAEVLPNEYAALGAGDKLQINFLYWPEIGAITQTIRLDGYISLPHIGRVKAEGLTPEQLHARLTELYKGLLKNPEISISVVSSDSKRVYVGGEVGQPQVLTLKKTCLYSKRLSPRVAFVTRALKYQISSLFGKEVGTVTCR